MSKENFFGRQTYLDILEKRIRNLKNGYRQNIAIIGDELIGKTAIIFKFLKNFYDNHSIIVYLEVMPEPFAAFARRFIGVLLYNFLINSGLPLEEDLDFLVKKASRYIPRTTEKIKAVLAGLEKRGKNDAFAELLSLCEILNQETNKFCVVILDEFHHLEATGIKNLYPQWSKVLVSQKNTMYIIASSLKFKTRAILSKHLSLLFGNFEIVNIEPFDTFTSEKYLEAKFKINQLEIPPGFKDFLVHFTGGHPFYLEMVSDACAKPGQAQLADILEDLLFEPSGILNQRFSNYLKRFMNLANSQDYLSIMYLISDSHNKIKEIAQLLHKTKKEISLKINYLLESDCLSRSGDFFALGDRVFGFWLKFVYQQRLNSLTFDAKNQKALFRDNLEAMIQEFLSQAKKPIAERIQELLRLFSDETLQIERKRLKLSHFREIKPLEFNHRGLREGLIGRSQDALWIMAFKNETLTEEDITEFAKECRKYRHKTQRKIIVAFRDIDTNAKLRALDEKILTWDLNNLNQVLDAFYKPRVIV